MTHCPYCYKIFKTWRSVRGHVSSCPGNTHEFIINEIHGPIHYSAFSKLTPRETRDRYPHLKSLTDIRKQFLKHGVIIDNYGHTYTTEQLISHIKHFVACNKRIPQTRDFCNNISYANWVTIRDHFGSWNKGIKAAGFEPNENDGFGTRTVANDGVLYRSNYETMFVDKFLYGKEEYVYELKYPKHNKFYDFYLPKRDLYIEIDGGCRPAIMEEKIKINKELGRNLLVLTGNEIASFKGF